MQLSEEEQQLTEALREWEGDDEHHLEIIREQGAWAEVRATFWITRADQSEA